jgi:hypothetical protein
MNVIVKKIIGRAETWPEEDQEELAQIALEIELRRRGAYPASSEELTAIDEALRSIANGEAASAAEVESLLARHRRA